VSWTMPIIVFLQGRPFDGHARLVDRTYNQLDHTYNQMSGERCGCSFSVEIYPGLMLDPLERPPTRTGN
jgi:hypothetical protein